MKKFIKWFLFWLVVCGGLALAICYIVIPEQTKNAIDVVVGYLNTPLGIIGGTSITLGLVLLVVLKAIVNYRKIKYKEALDEHKKELELTKQEIEKKFNEYVAQVNEQLEHTKTEINAINYTSNELVETIRLVPNKKVQERLDRYEETTNN